MVPDGWNRTTLEDYIDIKHGFAFKSEFFATHGKYVLMTPGHFYEDGGFRDQGEKTKYYVGEIPNGYILKKGDVLLAMTEQAAGLLGSAAYVPDDDKYLHNQRLGLIQIKDAKKACTEYMYLIYNSRAVRKQIAEQSSGTKVKHTSPDKLKGVLALVPSLSEQRKIAQILSTWDKAIATTEQLLANSQQQLKALMQQLLTGRNRLPEFFGKWAEIPLGDLGNTFSGLVGKTKEDFGAGEAFYIPYINIFKNSSIDMAGLEKVKVGSGERQSEVMFGDILFTTSSETPHEVGMSSVVLESASRLYLNSFCFGFRLSNFDSLLPHYARYLLRSVDVRRRISTMAQGATRYNLSKKQLMKLNLLLPPIKEQKAIASVLSSADRNIGLLKQNLIFLKQEKKALMQQLLTGERRVKIDTEQAA